MNVRKAVQTLAAAALAAGSVAVGVPPATAAETGPWPIVDQVGHQISTLTYNPDGQYAMACYAPAGVRVTVEELFTTGQTQPRVVPQFGRAVAAPYAGTGDVVAVRAGVDGFANPWHRVG